MEAPSRIRAEIRFPLILIHTPFGLSFFDRIAKTRAGRVYASFNTYLMPIITGFIIFLLVTALIVTFSISAVRVAARDVGPLGNVLIPGINPYLPIAYGWIALFATMVIHEAGHGIVARVYNLRVDSTGLLLVFGIPLGAFVNIERDELAKATLKQKSAVMTAGPMNNMLLAGVSYFVLFLVVSTLTPLPPKPGTLTAGLVIIGVMDNSLAQSIGLKPDTVITSVGGEVLESTDDLSRVLRENLGNSVEVTWVDSSNMTTTKSAKLPAFVEVGKPVLGVTVTPIYQDPSDLLARYQSSFYTNPFELFAPPTLRQYSTPFSDAMASSYTSTVFGEYHAVVANLLFWVWYINFNVGIFNALPIGPLDGGQLYGSIIDKKIKSRVIAKNATNLLTFIMILMVIASLGLPYILLD